MLFDFFCCVAVTAIIFEDKVHNGGWNFNACHQLGVLDLVQLQFHAAIIQKMMCARRIVCFSLPPINIPVGVQARLAESASSSPLPGPCTSLVNSELALQAQILSVTWHILHTGEASAEDQYEIFSL